MSHALSITVDWPYDKALAQTRTALSEHGVGAPTEIDVAATLKTTLDVDLPPRVILGARRPSLANQALQIDPHTEPVRNGRGRTDLPPAYQRAGPVRPDLSTPANTTPH